MIFGIPEWFIMENPIKINDLVVPLFSDTPLHRDQSNGWLVLHVGISLVLAYPPCIKPQPPDYQGWCEVVEIGTP